MSSVWSLHVNKNYKNEKCLKLRPDLTRTHDNYFNIQQKAAEVRSQKGQLKKIEDLGATMEERLILDNRYVHWLVYFTGLGQIWFPCEIQAPA